MKTRMILPSLFAITLFASISSGAEIWRNLNGTWTLLSSSPAASPVTMQAGQTVRLRITSTNNRAHLMPADIVPAIFQVGCEGSAPSSVSRSSAGKVSWSYNRRLNEYRWKTNDDWRGTCQMLVVRFKDGTEDRAKIRFE